MSEHKTAVEITKNTNDAERALRAMIDALILSDPGLKERLNIGACLHYLKLDDRTFGWNGDPSKPLTLEQKIACVMPTIANGLPPGYVVWMGNRPYALAEAWTHVVNRDVEKVSGMRWRPLTEEEKTMFCIQEGDMALAVEETVCIRGRELHWVGYGILGGDEMLPNHNGKYRVATRLTRDKVQFLRTRAVRDMYRRNYSLSGLSETDELELVNAQETRPLENVTPIGAPSEDPELKAAAIRRLTSVSLAARQAGGNPEDFIKVSLNDWMTRSSASAISDLADAIEHWLVEKDHPAVHEPFLQAN